MPPNTFVEEKIQLDTHKEDFETQIKLILEMDNESVRKNTTKLCNGYVNTYAYTKNLAERYLERYRGDSRVVINRPSMIYGCTKEPFPGWVDKVTPMGVCGLPHAMGMARAFFVPNVVLDFIPGDYVCNSILVTTAFASKSAFPEFKIYHNSISTSNPYKIYEFWKSGTDYLRFNPFE